MKVLIFNTLKKTIFLALFFCLSHTVSAVEVTELYQYNAPVDDKSQSEQRRANRLGFIGVLKKVSGHDIDRSHPAIKRANQSLSNFVMKYEFVETPYQTYLNIRYQPQMIDDVLKDMGVPIWGNRRPLTLIWLAIEENHQRTLVTKEDFPQLNQLLKANSENSGLPIVLPLLDLEDRMSVSVSDVWANFPEQIINASKRYSPEVIVSARLYRFENTWHLDWQFSNYASFNLNRLKGDKFTIVGELIGSISEQIAKQFATVAQDQEKSQVTIEFNDVYNLTAIENLKARLRSLTQVDEVDVIFRQGDKLELSVHINTNVDSLNKALMLDKQFERIVDPFSYGTEESLNYRWISQN